MACEAMTASTLQAQQTPTVEWVARDETTKGSLDAQTKDCLPQGDMTAALAETTTTRRTAVRDLFDLPIA